MTNYTSLSEIFGCTGSSSLLKNDKGFYMKVNYQYFKNTKRYLVTFPNPELGRADREAINTVSEKIILKIINSDHFIVSNDTVKWYS